MDEVLPSSGPPNGRDLKYEQRMRIEKYAKAASTHKVILVDREHLFSETVYGILIRGVSQFEGEFGPWLEKLLMVDPFIVYCRPPSNAILSTLGDRDQMVGVLEQGDALIASYDLMFQTMEKEGVRIYRYDYTQDPNAEKLVSVLNREYQRGKLQ